MRLKYPYLVLILSFTLIYAKAQLIVTFPMEKAVFQRNQNNLATLSIAGNYPINASISSIEARLINATTETVERDWGILQNAPAGGVFSGSLTNVPGGWYRLEVRSILNSNTIATAILNRIGVGEVFLIAGQSNAQGLAEYGLNATDERVVAHQESSWFDFPSYHCDIKFPSYPRFKQLSDGPIAKTGNGPWCYGKLGDLLTNKLGVPVAFFNAAATSTSSINWKESSDSLSTSNHYNGAQLTYCNQVGSPYFGLKRVMKYYASVFGARAILWHQGETDNYINLSATDYESNISYVIDKSRRDFGKDIPWVIAKATLFNNTDIQEDIRTAQQSLGNNTLQKIFPGPDTDLLNGDFRLDGVHFKENGLVELANMWNATLDDNFFSNATPIEANVMPVVTVSKDSLSFTLKAPDGYSSYRWMKIDAGNADLEDSVEANTQLLSRSSGNYRCYLTDSLGNITFTQTILCGCFGVDKCNGITYLSDIVTCRDTSGLRNIQLDKSIDGAPIKLKGVTYAKGIGAHTNSEIVYQLNEKFTRFISDIGIDDEASSAPLNYSSVYFRVYADNKLRYESPLIHASNPTVRVNINVEGVNELKLITNKGPDDFFYDHTDWAGARLYCIEDQKPTKPSGLVESQVGQTCARIHWTASTDNVEVEKYMIYINNMLIDSISSPNTNYLLQNLEQSHFYTVKVRAKDIAGNLSDNSDIIEIVTLSGFSVSSNLSLVNSGQAVVLNSSNCTSGTIVWSTGATTKSININPGTTTNYSATCKIGDCTPTSASVTVAVLPDCTSSYSLISPTDNFPGPNINLLLRASSSINARNSILTDTKISYQAGQSITLQPGFYTQPGSVFKAQISGCSD